MTAAGRRVSRGVTLFSMNAHSAMHDSVMVMVRVVFVFAGEFCNGVRGCGWGGWGGWGSHVASVCDSAMVVLRIADGVRHGHSYSSSCHSGPVGGLPISSCPSGTVAESGR